MLKIRLSKTGKKNAPSFRIVVTPEKRPRNGRALEVLGHFNPSMEPPTFLLDKKRLKYWLEQGAQMTGAVRKLAEGKYEFKRYHPKPPATEEGIEEKATKEEETAKGGEEEKGKTEEEEAKETIETNERPA